jgi:hypothetical protein
MDCVEDFVVDCFAWAPRQVRCSWVSVSIHSGHILMYPHKIAKVTYTY